MAAHSPSVRRRPGQFAETAPRTLVGLQKVNVQLQQEIDKLERQAATAVSNIANHQQAMKMSWRRLEHKRNTESPLLSRVGGRQAASSSPREKRPLFASHTKLYVQATPSIYGETSPSPPSTTTAAASEGSRESLQESRSSLKSLPPPTAITASYLRSSPYLSSPYTLRRGHPGMLNRATPTKNVSSTTPHPLTSTSQSAAVESSGEGKGNASVSGEVASPSESPLRLPQMQSASQSSLVAHSGTVDKATLLRASTLMGFGSHSQGPSAFRSFYTREHPPSSLSVTPLTSTQTAREESPNSKEERTEGGVERSNSEPTLAELFEQIKHCRYIRHYHPDGTAMEEYENNNN